jgi:hypothetical protein
MRAKSFFERQVVIVPHAESESRRLMVFMSKMKTPFAESMQLTFLKRRAHSLNDRRWLIVSKRQSTTSTVAFDRYRDMSAFVNAARGRRCFATRNIAVD